MEKKRKICYNCKFRGDIFRINGLSHLHCQSPFYMVNKPESAWETLREFWSSCSQFEKK